MVRDNICERRVALDEVCDSLQTLVRNRVLVYIQSLQSRAAILLKRATYVLYSLIAQVVIACQVYIVIICDCERVLC